MRAAIVAVACLVALTLGRAAADPERATVTDDELAAARHAKVGCADLAEVYGLIGSHTAIKLMTKACKRDRWALAAIVCYLRDGDGGYPGCETLLTKRARARLTAALAKADGTIAQEHRQWAIDTARKAGILGSTSHTGAFASLTGCAGDECASAGEEPPGPPPCDADCRARRAARDQAQAAARADDETIQAWAQPAYEQCTNRVHNLTIVVTIADHECTDVKISGQRRADEATRCLKALCAGADWSSVDDRTVTVHGRNGTAANEYSSD